MTPDTYDLAVIGGGLTGTAIARDAAGRGMSVFLAEALDLGEGASSATGGLVGGLLDHLQPMSFGRMRAAAAERGALMRTAPHLVQPTRFLVPESAGYRSRWRFRLGTRLLDRFAMPPLKKSRRVHLKADYSHGLLAASVRNAYAVADSVADDSRLVVLNAVDARVRGASIRPRVRCNVAEREGERWRLSLESTVSGEPYTIEARVLVNATGASVGTVNDHVIHTGHELSVRLVKRAYIVVRRSIQPGEAYALPSAGGRFVYAVPMAGDLALVGPIVTPFDGDPATVAVDRDDAVELLEAANAFVEAPIGEDDIVSGVAAAWAVPVTGRPWSVTVDAPSRQAPLVSMIGPTLTMHRRAAEAAVSAAARFIKAGPAWTAGGSLPGGGFPPGGVGEIARVLATAYRFVPPALALRLARAYGTRAPDILTGSRVLGDLGRRFGADLMEAEVNYLRREEWAASAADILWRRSKLGFHFSAAEAVQLDAWLKRNRAVPAGPVMP